MLERVEKSQIITMKTEEEISQEIEQEIDSFVNTQDVFQSSKDTYRRELRVFFNWLRDEDLLDKTQTLQREDILRYRDHLKETKKSTYTVSGYMTVVRKYFEWLESRKVYPNIARSVKGGKRAKGFKKECLTISQIRNSLNNIDTSTLEGKRDYALFNLLVRTGLRTIEVSRALIGDMSQKSGESVLNIQGKGREDKNDFVLLTPEALTPIMDYLNARQLEAKKRRERLEERNKINGKEGEIMAVDTEEDAHKEDAPLFASISDRNYGEPLSTRSISRIIKNRLIQIGLNSKRYTAHSLRHTAVTLAIQGGASLQQAQAMARHSSPETTQIYFHNFDRVRNGAEKNIRILEEELV